jgi:putative peptidoglycan lipid II flippase
MGHGGIALSTSLASMLNLGLLVRALRTKLGALGLKGIIQSACKIMVCSGIMGAVVWAISLLIIPSEDGTLSGLFFGLMGSIMTGLVLYGSFSLLLKSEELKNVLVIAGKGINKK